MPKSLPILPALVRKPGTLDLGRIPLNAYQATPAAEAARFGSAGMVRMYRDMALIREFETMLQRIKVQGNYSGIACEHKGPAHLSIGQEAAAVGMAWALGPEDMIFGSHRSHGEILAKCLSAIAKLPEERIPAMLEAYGGGRTLRAVERFSKGSARDVALDYVLYGTLAEILGRDAGFNRGLGGSMHAFFPPFGVMPNNAIVGGSAGIAAGAALHKRVQRKPGVVVANIGDAAAGCGPVWEAMGFASMDQYRTLWSPALGGAPPILFNFMNNFYGMGGQTSGETMGFGVLARLGAGVNPENMHAERVDGYNPLAVADAFERKIRLLKEGRGPALLDTVTYRISGHSPSDASSYRDKHEVERWQQADSIAAFGAYLIANGHCGPGDLDAIRIDAEARMVRALGQAAPPALSPRIPAEAIGGLMYSFGKADRTGEGIAEVTVDPDGNPRLSALRDKSRSGPADGKPLPAGRAVTGDGKAITYADALFEAMLHRFREDPGMIAFGEENRDWGGAFSVYRGLTECLPYHRLFNAPISEAAIAGAAVGYALSGGRAVAEIMYCDFLGRAGDEVFNQMAKWQAMSGGALRMPLVLRVSVGSKYGAQHSQDWSSLTAHIPGLQVMFPATPFDAKGMLNLALRGTDPVVFLESQRLYAETERFAPSGVPEGYYEVEMGMPAVRRSGTDLTIVTIGAVLYRALEAAEELERVYGISAEVIDMRFLNPLDYGPILESVRRTGAALLASDACERGSFLHTAASRISQAAFEELDAPVTTVGARNWITPAAEMEDAFFPQKDWILDAIHENIRRLPGRVPLTRQAAAELRERDRIGI